MHKHMTNDQVIALCDFHAATTDALLTGANPVLGDVYTVLCDAWERARPVSIETIAARITTSIEEVIRALDSLLAQGLARRNGFGHWAF
jgi:hypothetical protein